MEGERYQKAQDHPSIICFLYSVYMQRVVLPTWCQDLPSTRIFLAELGRSLYHVNRLRKGKIDSLHCPANSLPYLEDSRSMPPIRWYICLETTLIDGIFAWKRCCLGNSDYGVQSYSRKKQLNGRNTRIVRKKYCSKDVIKLLKTICKEETSV